MSRRWTPSEDVAVRLADALDYEHGGGRLRELAERLGRSEAAVRQRASRLRAARLKGSVAQAALTHDHDRPLGGRVEPT